MHASAKMFELTLLQISVILSALCTFTCMLLYINVL